MKNVANASWVGISALGLLVGACGIGCGSSVGDFNVAPPDDGGGDGANDGAGGEVSNGDTGGSTDGALDDSALADADDTGTTSDDTGASDDSGVVGSDTGILGDSGISSDSGSPLDAGDGAVVCPAPTPGAFFVSPTGSDTTGNGSQACPFVTITHALSFTPAATGPTKIFVASGTAAAPNVYGVGCTAGAGNCDATPIRVSDGMNKGIVIQGTTNDPRALTVVGGTAATDIAVFVVNAPNVGFANLSVVPMKIAAASPTGRVAGADGIRFAGPAVGPGSVEASITNVTVTGIIHTAATESTGSGISMQNGTSPTVGPGVNIVGGDHSVLVTQAVSGATVNASHPSITSSAASPSFFHSAQFACVRVESTNAAATILPTATLTATTGADPGRLHLQDCGGNGGVAVDTAKAGNAVDVTNTLIDASPSSFATVAFYGIRLLNSGVLKAGSGLGVQGLSETTPAGGVASAAIEAGGNSQLTIAGLASVSGQSVIVTRNAGTGVHVLGSAHANIDGLNSSNNKNGILCDAAPNNSTANLTLRDSSLLSNNTFGLWVGKLSGGGCLVDLGSVGSAGNNVYNTTANANGVLGICYQSSNAVAVTSSTWGCGLGAAAACQPAGAVAPKPIASTACDVKGGDYSDNSTAKLTVAIPQTCCGI